jgi:WD40 repeat protein
VARVFVSHAGDGGDQAGEVYRWLVEAGHEVFLDRDHLDGIVVGEQWRQRLHERLRWADAVVCVVTAAYVASRWCAAEVEIARSRGSRLLPLQAVPGVVDPALDSVQHVDMTRDPAAARAELVAVLRRVDAAGGFGWPDDRSPFPGLHPFEVDQHRVFFGRTAEKKELAELLRSPAVRAGGAALLVVGPSGCGKSSLVRAGLVPVMAGEPGWWTLSPIVPGTEPIAALVRELAAAARRIGLGWTVAQVRQQLDDEGLVGLVDELLLAAPGGPQRRLLVVVDQFEELLTQTASTDRVRFVELLRSALAGPVQLVATLRSEFLDQLLIDPTLGGMATRIYTVRPLGREGLRAVIAQPARLSGIDVDTALVDQLVEDTDTGEALPLLAFTLAQLADGVSRGGRLSAARYEQLGGVGGALIRQADSALTAAVTVGGRSQQEVIAGLLRLVTVDEAGRPTRWRTRRDELPGPVATELDAFVERRLLTTDDANGSAVIGVAHEAFLSAWPPLHDAIAASASALRARRAVEHAATAWHDHGRPPSRLWGGGQLAAAIADTGARIHAGLAPPNASPPSTRGPGHWLPHRHRVLITDRVDLSPTARDFLHTSSRLDRYRRRRAITVLSALLVLALLAGGIAFQQYRTALRQRHLAIVGKLDATSRSLAAKQPDAAMLLAVEAFHLEPVPETRSALLSAQDQYFAGQLAGHVGIIYTAMFSHDGRMLATAGDDGTAQLWDIANRQQIATLTGHADSIFDAEFSPDDRILVTAGKDGTARLWDVASRQQIATLPTGGPGHELYGATFSHNGRIVATAGKDGTARLWDIANHQQIATLTGHTGPVYGAEFSPDDRILATTGGDGTARLWDVANHQQIATLTGHTGRVNNATFSPNGHILVTVGDDTTAKLWDVASHQQIATLTGHTGRVNNATFSPDGDLLVTGSGDGTARLWDVAAHQQVGAFEGISSINGVAFSPDGHTVATAGEDTIARLWNTGGPILIPSPPAIGYDLVFSPDGRILVTAGDDGTARLWDVTSRHRIAILTGHTGAVYAMAFSPDGRILVTAGDDGTARLWDTVTHQPIATLAGHPGVVRSVAFSPDGRTLVTAGDNATLRLWDTVTHQPIATLTGHTGIVYAATFSPDGRSLVTAGDDATVRLWDTVTYQPIATLTGHPGTIYKVAFSPDGRSLATAGEDATVRLWDTATHQPIATLTGHTVGVKTVAFSRDGHTLVTASRDGTAKLWDVDNQQLIATLTGHTGVVYGAAFSPDGAPLLATAGADRTVRLWDLDVNRVTDRICHIIGTANLAQWARLIPELPYQPTCH